MVLSKREKRVRRHVFLTPAHDRWLQQQRVKTKRSLGEILDHVIEEFRRGETRKAR